MRRLTVLAVVLAAALFASVVVPGSPVLGRIVRMLGDRPSRPAAPELSSPAPTHPVLRVAVGAMISPERTYADYAGLFAEVARREHRTLRLVQRSTYRDLNDLIRRGEVDVAWICTGAWPELRRDGAARLLAIPVVNRATTYNALLIGTASRPARDLASLRGARFVFTDPLSLTGCLYPTRRVKAETGLDPATFFGETRFTHGHDNSIEAVRRGFADAASVDSLVFDYLRSRSPAEVDGVRILETSPPFPIPPLVVPSQLPVEDEASLRNVFLRLSDDLAGRARLSPLLVDRFAIPDPPAYDGTQLPEPPR